MIVRLSCRPIAPWIGSQTPDVTCDAVNDFTGEPLPWAWHGRTNEEAIGRALIFLFARDNTLTVSEIKLLTGGK